MIQGCSKDHHLRVPVTVHSCKGNEPPLCLKIKNKHNDRIKKWISIDKKTKDIKLIFSFKKCIKQKILSEQGNDSSGK